MTQGAMISGRLVTDYELSLLHELLDGDDTAQSIGINVGPDGWTVLRKLSSLEARGLVEHYTHESGLTAWRLTDAGRGTSTRTVAA